MPKLEFWYDFASTYSYLSAMRIEELGQTQGIEILWRPFLLGPIFKAQGWDTSPFSIFVNKGRYMVRDMERIAAERDLPFKLVLAHFPGHSLAAARIGIIGAEEGWAGEFTRALYRLQFQDGQNIADPLVLSQALRTAGQDPDAMLARIRQQAVKDALRAQTEIASTFGIFGAPTFVTEDGEMFWGDDRLEQALAWSSRR
jgi:2-hydroxychromene-2-carboxylate isomerase